MDLRVDMGQVFDSLQYLPHQPFLALFGVLRITVKRLTRSTSDVTFASATSLFKQH